MSPALASLRSLILLSLGGCGGGEPEPCQGSTPILLADGAASGFERCADGAIHRAAAAAVDPGIDLDRCAGTEGYRECEADADCAEGPHGACLSREYSPNNTACECVYACSEDADCGPGELCLPPGVAEGGETYARCIPAGCAADADCESGECGLSSWHNECEWVQETACRAPADECRVDADCPGDEPCGVEYAPPNTVWTCSTIACTDGRPLTLASGGSRVAPVRADGAWAGGADLAGVAPDEEQAARWERIALAEHASVGSFARFTLQLLALGAPPDLVADAQRAAADEVRHAQGAFALASAYAGRAVGPGPMALADVGIDLDPGSILRALVIEGCVGETLAAAEVAEDAQRERGPIQAFCRRVAEDEARHAALAWRTLRWMLAQRPDLAPRARDALREGIARYARDDRTRAAAKEVVEPCWRALRAA